MKITPKNWDKFQHYKTRNPPWIKLHKELLDDFDWWRLPVASRALAPCIWMYASCFENGIIDADYEKLAFRFRMTTKEVESALKPLIDNGYFIVDSVVLAGCKQVAIAETETETETETYLCANGFDEFWNAYPRKVGKTSALKAFNKLKPNVDLILTALEWQIETEQWVRGYIPYPQKYLNENRWLDEPMQERNAF
jgi:hypothetical protein